MVDFYTGTAVAAELVPQEGGYKGWVFINWTEPGEKKFSAVKDVKRIEQKIKEQRLKGWLASSEKDHTTMHTILTKMGAACYGQDDHSLHFMKEVA